MYIPVGFLCTVDPTRYLLSWPSYIILFLAPARPSLEVSEKHLVIDIFCL